MREMEAPRKNWRLLHGPKHRTPVSPLSLITEPRVWETGPETLVVRALAPAPTLCRDSTPASCFLPGALGCLFSAGEGPPPCHLGLLAAQTHSQAFLNTPTAGHLFAWQNLFVFGAVTCQEVTRPWERGAGLMVARGSSHSHAG